jgi:hypothetical protein
MSSGKIREMGETRVGDPDPDPFVSGTDSDPDPSLFS